MSLKKLAYICSPSAIHPFFRRIEASDVGSRLAHGVFWSMAGSVISRGLMLCATVLIARMLGKTVYGELGMIQSTVGMFGVFAGFGLGLTATKHVAEFRQSDPERTSRIIGISGLFAMGTGGLMAIGLLIFAPWLAESTINAPHLTGALRIGALILFINALNGAQTGALAGFEAFKTIAYVNLFVGLISFPILIGGAYFGGLTGAVWALAINLCFNWLLNHVALRKEASRYCIPFTFKNCSREWPVLWRFSLPAVLAEILVGPARWGCHAMMVNQPDGYNEMGVFTASLIIQNLLLFASGMLNPPLLAMLSNNGSIKNKRLESANIIFSWLIGLLPALPLLCFPEIVEFFFGMEYEGKSFRITFAIIVYYTCILTYRSGLLRILQSKSLIWWGFFNNLLWAFIMLPTSYFLTKFGAVGLAMSFAISYVITSIIFVPIYIKYGDVPRALILSKEVAIIWIVITFLSTTTLLNIPILFRIILFPFIIYTILISMKNIWIKNAK